MLNLHFLSLCNIFFLLCCWLNVSLNELYPDKTNKNKDYNFCITFFSLSVTLYSVLAAKCYLHFSVNTFKTLDKTNKINTILCRLNFYLLAYLAVFQQKCEQTANISRERVSAE